ncbi:DUF1565 domain-containing protein [Coraliomargarita sp. W4R53]
MPTSTHCSEEINQVFHVSPAGADEHPGTVTAPLKTITAASALAMPGDTILVHSGTYRERIDPPRGGVSTSQRITYQAAEGEKVQVLGSERIDDWQRISPATGSSQAGTLWQARVSNQLFGDFNPYRDLIHGDWFNDLGRKHHTGGVYLDGEALVEAQSPDALKTMHWFATVGSCETTIWANFENRDPNTATTEINVRPTVFYPSQTGINYITLRGFSMRHAATNWAPPTSEQIGLIGTNWSQGWIIEDNVISHSRCTGITLGKHGDTYDNTSADSATGYVDTIQRARAHGWHRNQIGSHIVRNNEISHCEQAGINGSLGAIFSQITGNKIHDIYQQRSFAGEELAAIKIHAAIDTLIADNHIYNSYRAIWLDWMAQGSRVTQNLCHDNDLEDLFLEVNLGPIIVDGNLLLSPVSLNNLSQGSAFVQNVFAGKLRATAEPNRKTPSLKAHSTEFHDWHAIVGGDDLYINNLVFDQSGLEHACASQRDALTGDWSIDPATGFFWVHPKASQAWPSQNKGNLKLTTPPELFESEQAYQLRITVASDAILANERVHSNSFGNNMATGLPYLNYDGSTIEWSSNDGIWAKLQRGTQTLRVKTL